MGGGIFATTFWMLWQNGGGEEIVTISGVLGYRSADNLPHYRAARVES